MPREHFFGFYPTPPIWIGEKPTPAALGNMRSGNKLYEFMATVEASESRGDFRIDVTRDGLIALSVKPLAEKVFAWREAPKKPPDEEQVAVWSEALEYLNCLNLLLQSAFKRVLGVDRVHLAEVTMYNAFLFESEEGKKFAKGSGWVLGYSAHVFNARFSTKYASNAPVALDERVAMRIPATVEMVKSCFEDFFRVVDTNLVRETAVISRALAQYKVANYSSALVLLWFLIEEFIDDQWKAYLAKADTEANGEKRLNADRKRYLSGRDFSASIVSNMLELVGSMDLALYKMIDRVRGYRNAIVHSREDFEARAIHCKEAFEIAKLILEKRGGPSLELSLSFGVPSL